MKMEIVIVLLIVILALVWIASICFIYSNTDSDPYACVEAGGRFVILEERTTRNTVYAEMYDANTKVMYVYVKLSESGSISVLYDADGTPLLYEGN